MEIPSIKYPPLSEDEISAATLKMITDYNKPSKEKRYFHLSDILNFTAAQIFDEMVVKASWLR